MADDWAGIPKVSAEYVSLAIFIYRAYSCPVCRGRAVVYSYARHAYSAKCMSCHRAIARGELAAMDRAETAGHEIDVNGDDGIDSGASPR